MLIPVLAAVILACIMVEGVLAISTVELSITKKSGSTKFSVVKVSTTGRPENGGFVRVKLFREITEGDAVVDDVRFLSKTSSVPAETATGTTVGSL